MPGLPSDQATLEEVLEVRAEPLNEEELWSVLLQSGNSLENVLGKTAQERLLHLALTLRPDTLLLCLDGHVKFAITKHATANKNFIAPESFTNEGKWSKTKIEKMLVYCLGMTAFAAAENGIDENKELIVSKGLERLLLGMITESIPKRYSLHDVTQIASQHIGLEVCHSKIKSLASEIVGPYGLKPLSVISNLPGEPNRPVPTYKYAYDEDPKRNSALEPLSSLAPLLNHQTPRNNGYNLPGNRSYSSGSDDEAADRGNLRLPAVKGNLIPRSIIKTRPAKAYNPSQFIADDSRPWSPSLSSPDLGKLMKLEHDKLEEDRYMRETPRMLSPNKSLSMPSLNDIEEVDHVSMPSGGSKQDIHKRLDRKRGQKYRSVDDCASLTSQFSSQMSLTRGAYVLDSEPNGWSQEFPLKRSNSGSSMALNSRDLRTPSGQQLPIRPLDILDLANLGPEFVKVAENPDEAFVDIAPPRLGPLPKGTRKVNVHLPNNQQIQTNVQVNDKAKEVFEQIIEHIKLKETLYFGLTYIQDGEELFIDLDTKLNKYAPTGWKDENPKKKRPDFILYFRVKFFLQNPTGLKHCLTVHLYYLQLRQYLLSGYIQCPDDVLMNLASLALQAEYGPYLPEYTGVEYFKKEFYIPGRVLSRMNRAELYRNLPRLHDSRGGMSPEVAELTFLEHASQLPEYGIVFHKVSRSKKIETDYVWLGIRIAGVVVVEPRGKQRTTVHEQSWDSIKEFTFEKKKFVLKPKNPDEHPKLVFYTNHYRKSKYLFKMCQSFHRFEIFHQTRVEQLSRKEIRKSDQVKEKKMPYKGSKKNNNLSVGNSTASNNSPDHRLVKITLHKSRDEGLGLIIVGGGDSKRIAQGIFIKSIKLNSVCALDGRLNEGDEIVSVNGENLQQASHEEAADILRESNSPLELMVKKSITNISILDKSGLSPNMNKSQMMGNSVIVDDDVRNKLSNISFVDDESDSAYSERPIDVEVVGRKPSSKGHSKTESDYDDPGELDLDVVISKYIPEVAPDKVMVNNVEVDNGINDSLSERYSNYESNDSESCVSGLTGLKRFSGFEGALDQVGVDSNDDNDDGDDDEVDGDVTLNRTLDETIEEVAVDLEKIDNSFGFSIHGGKESNLPLGCIYVKAVQVDGAAAVSRRIRAGDRILAVNGLSLENVSHEEAVNILKTAPDKSTILLDRGIETSDAEDAAVSVVSEKIASLKMDDAVFEAAVEKRANGLGLSLIGGRDSDICYNEQIMIKKLFPGYAMYDSGKFQVGDVLLIVNDQIIEGMSNQEATAVIRTAPKHVRIIARRPNRSDIPAELFETERPVSPEKLLQDVKHLDVSGRVSREGNRIAKELLESLTCPETDEDSVNENFSSQVVTNTDYDVENDDDDANMSASHDLPIDLQKDDISNKNSLSMGEICGAQASDEIEVAKEEPNLCDGASDEDSDEEVRSKDVDSRHMSHSVVKNESSTDTDTPLGFPRHRPPPPEQQSRQMTGNIEKNVNKEPGNQDPPMLTEDKKTPISETIISDSVTTTNTISSSSYSPAMSLPRLPYDDADTHDHPYYGNQSPVLYPSSPGALKNLNILSRNTSFTQKKRRSSLSSRTSSTGEIISIQLEKGDKGLGITLGTNTENDVEPFVYIKKLVPGSVADRNGRLRAGDRILSVNGKNVESLPQKDVVGIFRALSGTVSMEFYRYPDQSLLTPRHKHAEEAVVLKLPTPPQEAPPKSPSVTQQHQSPSSVIKQDIQLRDIAKKEPLGSSPLRSDPTNSLLSAETRFDLPVLSTDDVTFNSHDGLSFANSLLSQTGDGNVEGEGAKMIEQNVADSINIDALEDTSSGSEFSFSAGMDENGILGAHDDNVDVVGNRHTKDNTGDVVSRRPPSGIDEKSSGSHQKSVTRTSSRGSSRASGIPRLVVSRSNSLNSDASGYSSRRTSAGSVGADAPTLNALLLDDSQDHFIERKLFSYYSETNVTAMLQNIEKRTQTSFLNPEFMALRQIKTTESLDAGSRACNRSKNRVKTILPFDRNRVRLTGGEESDYINASHVKIGESGTTESNYIVCQAPMSTTVEDFWRCVWEKKIEVIVMLTREEENGKMKCQQYWPAIKKIPTKILDKFTVELLYEEYNGSYIYRQIQIKNLKLDKSIFVTQGCFTQWPDTGVPQDPIEFLGFMKFVRNFSVASPTLIHCSAGVGRSGVYVVVDSIWSSIENDLAVDVAKVTRQAKEQRHMLIQTKEQYAFIYEAVRELFIDLRSTVTQRHTIEK